VRHVFVEMENSAAKFWAQMGIAVIAAILTTHLGFIWGNWMRRIRR